ncbi:MAG: BatD family protein [Nitrospirota bacterium]|nr:BatD family protein [Nitrospirota bacterium]
MTTTFFSPRRRIPGGVFPGLALFLAVGLGLALPVLAPLAVRPAHAGDITVEATVDPAEVALGETLTYTVTVGGDTSDVGEPALGKLDGFEVVSSGKSTMFRSVNGDISRQVSWSFTLVAREQGEHVLEGTTVRVGGNSFLANRVTARVGPASSRSRPRSPAPGAGGPGFPGMPDPFGLFGGSPGGQGVAAGDVEIATAVDRPEAWVGEQVILTFTFRRAIDLFASPNYDPPDAPGFRAVDLEFPNGEDTEMRREGGRRWVVLQRKTALFPLASGPHTIGPAGLDFSVTPFSPAQHLQTEPIRLRVKPLPEEGRPTFFDGAVGSFSMRAAPDRSALRVGDSVTLAVTIQGSGNFADIRRVDLPVTAGAGAGAGTGDGFEIYDPEIRDRLDNTPQGVKGSRTLSYVLVARREGEQVIGPVRFAAFDPKSGSYRTMEAGPFTIQVSPAAAPAPAAASGAAPAAAPARPSPAGDGGERSRSLLWAGATLAVGLALLAWRLVTRRRAGDAPERNGGPAPLTLEQLAAAPPPDDADFVRELDRSLRAGLGAAWGLPGPQVDPGSAASHLAAAAPEARQRVLALLEQLAALRFAPGTAPVDRAALLDGCRQALATVAVRTPAGSR